MSEIARVHSCSDHEKIVFEFSIANPRANNFDRASDKTDALNLGEQHAEIFLFRLELTDRRRYLGGRQDSRGDLIQERLKDMVIASVDQRDFDIGSLERPRCRDAGEAAADDQDAFLAWDRLCYRWCFLRKRFGQNCGHGCTDALQGQSPD
jgi:hypothetical protein